MSVPADRSVALALDRFGASRGGTERWTADFAAALVARGWAVHVVCRSFDGPVPDGIEPHLLPKLRDRVERADAAAEIVAGLPVDVAHDMGLGWCADVLHLHAGSRTANRGATVGPLGTAWRAIVGRHLPRDRAFAELDRRRFATAPPPGFENTGFDGPGYRTASRVIAVSRRSAEEVSRYDGVGPDRLRVVPNGVDVAFHHPTDAAARRPAARRDLHLPGDAPTLLAVAHNHRLKGVPELLRATARLANGEYGPQFRAVRTLVAGGKRGGATGRLAGRLGITDRVTLLGAVSDVRPLLAAADLLVHSTKYDPFALVVTEALASGRPVVCSTAAGASELIPPGAGAVLDDPADDATLARLIADTLPTAAARATVHAARSAAERHSFAANVDGVLAVYGEALAARGARRRAA